MDHSNPIPATPNHPAEPRAIAGERDACGVGFIASQTGESSHQLVRQALSALGCLEHRGACSADRDTGDGAGLMSAIPWPLFRNWLQQQQCEVPNPERFAVGMVFLPQQGEQASQARACIEQVLQARAFRVLGWREVPIDHSVLGPEAQANQPRIEQVLVAAPEGLQGDALERALYPARAAADKQLAAISASCHVCSLSSRTLVYKGMLRSAVLGEFFQDLQDPHFESPFAVYHRRFSTNTMPRWPLAQPMRLLGHNGEINTLQGNINWMAAREAELASPHWSSADLEALTPLVDNERSDSANLDSVMELLVRAGHTPAEAVAILVPEAYQNQPELASYPEIVDFYEYYSGIQEPWDGPAMLTFSDGKTVGAALDRNGLRPARYCITREGYAIVSSEAGVVEIPEGDIVEKGRLGPGQTIAVDLERGEILKNWEIKQRIARQNPYGEWVRAHRAEAAKQPFSEAPSWDEAALRQQQAAFGYTAEDLEIVIQPMATQGKEPTFCMGDDIPLAVLSQQPHLLYDYFKQRFAQVTNPAIDPLRESLVMSLSIQLGARGNWLHPQPEDARLLKLESPVLNEAELAAVREHTDFGAQTLSTLYPAAEGPSGLEPAVRALCDRAEAAVRAGTEILVLSDRAPHPVDADHTYIPPLVAVGAVHHHLIRQGLRMRASLIVDTAQCWSTHHYACAIGYGASAVCPYLALESVRQWCSDPKTQKLMDKGKLEPMSCAQAQQHYRKAVETGLLKILSKMGISLLSSYHGAQIFEAVGIGPELCKLAFAGTTSRVGGLTVSELAQETLAFHQRGFPEPQGKKLENAGFVNARPGGEYHMNSPEMAKALHKAVRAYDNLDSGGNGHSGNGKQAFDHYELYKQHLQQRPATALRDLLDFASDREAISIEEVEPVEAIVERFCTGAMSLGALSREAHESLAIAMNRIGGKSNSGEGGEDPLRFEVLNDVDGSGHSPTLPHLSGLKNGDTASSAIKQVASGRFGVTPEYLMSARQVEIKIAQGSKPGEGGQLPGKKVSPYIAMLRRSKPGVPLISPPPHHDIYSIEDLAQLIFDLHQINPQAGVSVKLVAEIGIGTIAAGVAKANADIIQVSGQDGGTGASPLSSIKHAGLPWELGVTEVHRTLMANGLRDRVVLRTDGGLKTGWDVLMAALLGAEEYGFGSVSMIAEGCIMARICHTNNCPVGVATQQERLRQRFSGTPGHVVNFFYFVAQEVRSLLARLGYRRLSEVIGRSDLLQPRSDLQLAKTQRVLDGLDCLLDLPDARADRSWLAHSGVHGNGPVLDDRLLRDPDIASAIRNRGRVRQAWPIANTDRAVGARLAGAIARQHGDTGFDGQIALDFSGTAGQSFGAFTVPGMALTLTGEANDYVGKGMHGGEIAIQPAAEARYDPAENAIIGNTCLYGATGGVLYANGRAGERFGVRNSFARAVVLGAGDHCCEYMTGGAIVVLGPVGRNVGAGMTGGLGYFLDEDGRFPERVNGEIVKLQRVVTQVAERQLWELIATHAQKTGSRKAQRILDDWQRYLPQFWQIVPPAEENTQEANPQASEAEEKVLASAQ